MPAILYVCFVDFTKYYILFCLPIYTYKLLTAFPPKHQLGYFLFIFLAYKDIILYAIQLGSTKFK